MLATRIYDRYEAVEYALRYAIIPNPAYYDFSAIGGDCTNFVSQCLYAGCKVMNYSQNGWYYNNINSRSPSWTSVEALYRFLTTNKSVGPRGYAVNLKEAQIGDIIQLGDSKTHFYHSLFVTEIKGDDILVCARTQNSKQRSVYTYRLTFSRTIHIDDNVYVY